MKRRALIAAATVLMLIVLLTMLWSASDEHAAAARDEFVVAPRVFASTVIAIGAVKPSIGAEVRVGSRISGRVARLPANIGDQVAKGQIIAELETAELDAVVAQRRAELMLAEAQLAALENLLPDEEGRAQADVARLTATLRVAAEEAERQQELVTRDLAPRALADAARDRHLAAQAELESAARTLRLVRIGRAEDRKQAAAEAARARAALESAQVDLSFTSLLAPIGGVVASVSTQEGETVAAGLNAPTFLTIIDLQRLQVHAYVDEVDIGKVEVGQQASFGVDAFPGREFAARVAAIYPTATIQDNVVKYIVVLEIDDDYAGALRPEMTTNVRIELVSRSALAVPARAVRPEGQRNVVYVMRDGQPEARAVRVGWRDGPWTEIVDGLAAGERILLEAPSTDGG